jgi:hypothetical protein
MRVLRYSDAALVFACLHGCHLCFKQCDPKDKDVT